MVNRIYQFNVNATDWYAGGLSEVETHDGGLTQLK